MAKCLVTGASGFIGTHLVKALVERGDDVRCLVRKTSKLQALEGLPLKFVEGDVRSGESLTAALADCDVVYHLAGLTKALTNKAFFLVNAGGIESLMQAAAKLPKPPVVIFVSSLAAAGPAVDGQPREPHHIPKPVSSYGKSKLAGEILASQLSDRVPLTILRPPIVIGEGDQLTLDLFHSVATFRFHLVPGWTPAKVSIIHAADLVQAMILAAERGKRVTPAATAMLSSGYKILTDGAIVPRVPPPDLITQQEVAANAGQGIYFPADEAMPDFAEFGQLMARGLGRKRVRCIHTPHAGAFVLGAISEFVGKILRKPMALNLDKAREAVAGNWTCSPRTAREDLAFHPGAPLAERFRQTVRWYCDEGWI